MPVSLQLSDVYYALLYVLMYMYFTLPGKIKKHISSLVSQALLNNF